MQGVCKKKKRTYTLNTRGCNTEHERMHKIHRENKHEKVHWPGRGAWLVGKSYVGPHDVAFVLIVQNKVDTHVGTKNGFLWMFATPSNLETVFFSYVKFRENTPACIIKYTPRKTLR